MFANQTSKQHIQIPQEISLNFTVTSRSTKPQKKDLEMQPPPAQTYQPQQTIHIVNNQIENFNQWLSDTQDKFQICYNNLSSLMVEIQNHNNFKKVCQQDILIIKKQVLKKDFQGRECVKCEQWRLRIQQLQLSASEYKRERMNYEQNIKILEQQINKASITTIKQTLVRDAQINLLNNDIAQLNQQINTLKNQKSLLERTFMFNKTRNSELNLLQKSKSLSAAKNSTNSSDLNMLRNQQTIIFIDPIESDVDEWIKFFEQQKNRYANLLKKEQSQKQKEFIRSINRQERMQQNQNKITILYTCLKQIHKNLLRVRQNTNNFQMIQSISKYGLREKLMNNNDGDYTFLKQENEKLMVKINELKSKIVKLSKINDYLCKEKQNIEQINQNLKEQRIKQNNYKYELYQKLLKKSEQCHFYQQKYLQFKQKLQQMQKNLICTQDLIKQITTEVKRKQQQLQLNKTKQKYYNELQKQSKKIQKQLLQINKQHKVQINTLALKLKKDYLQRKKIYNQLEQLKGNVRLYCKIIDHKNFNQINHQIKDFIFQIQNQKIFNKIFYGQNNSQQKIYQDIRKLVYGAFDGYHFTLLSYSQSSPNKSSLMHGNSESSGIISRVFKQIFRYIQGEKQFMQIEVSLNVLQLHNDKFIGLLANEKLCNYQIKQNQQGNVYLANYPQFMVENLQQLEEIYQDSLASRKLRDKYKNNNKSHFIITIILQINNKKTQENYKSRINLIELAQIDKISTQTTKQNNFINKSISSLFNAVNALNNKQKVNLRENKLTHYLKDSLSSPNKAILLFTLNCSQLMRQQTKSVLNFAGKFRSVERNRRQSEKQEISRQRRSISRKNM